MEGSTICAILNEVRNGFPALVTIVELGAGFLQVELDGAKVANERENAELMEESSGIIRTVVMEAFAVNVQEREARSPRV